MSADELQSEIHTFKCNQCGADLTYAPGTEHLKCDYCGAENIISSADVKTAIEETDYKSTLAKILADDTLTYQVHTVKCNACGSSTTLAENVTSDNCPYCDSPLVVNNATSAFVIKPQYMLPFKCSQQEATLSFQKWVKGLWFAPNKFKVYAYQNEKLHGIYIPYWTYDTDTWSAYTGERGTNHTEYYTTTENGKTVRRSRTVIRWHYVSGSVSVSFDDILVIASSSLPEHYADKLEPWDLSNLAEYNEAYLSGYKSESYQTGLEQGFERARVKMDSSIRSAIQRDIGGDHQRIHSVKSSYNNITFKHILLPIWISSYTYNKKTYRFMINGRTSEVQGERPWSWVKITLAALAASGIIATAVYYLAPYFNR